LKEENKPEVEMITFYTCLFFAFSVKNVDICIFNETVVRVTAQRPVFNNMSLFPESEVCPLGKGNVHSFIHPQG
jgi:hypothetical protein